MFKNNFMKKLSERTVSLANKTEYDVNGVARRALEKTAKSMNSNFSAKKFSDMI